MRSPILGASYRARSVNAAADRCVNLYPESIPEGGKETGALYRAPGTRTLVTVGIGPIRGEWQLGDFGYVASGYELYSVSQTYDVTLIGMVTGSGPVLMSDNGTQIFIACNPDGFIYNTSTGVFAQISDPDFPGANFVGYLDGYFVFTEPNSQRVWVTQLLDGTSVDPLDFASAEGSPDGLVGMIIDHSEAWLLGTNSVQVYYDANAADFPLAPIQGAFIEHGCVSGYSIAKMDNSIFWLGQDQRGQGIVWRANGYTPQRVSTHALEYAISTYADISDAIAYTYQQQGHSIYVLTFPTGNATWAYDAATNLWQERAYLNPATGELGRHRSNCHMFFNGMTVVGDYENGSLYEMSLNIYADDGDAQKWIRAWRALPTGTNTLNRTIQHSLQIDCETGVGLDGPVTTQGYDPQVTLRWSDDGGHTWSNGHRKSMGRIGEFGRRVIFRRLGSTEKIRDRVYELSGTDPVPITIVGARLLLNEAVS